MPLRDPALGRSEKTSAMLLTFQFGATPTVVRYTDWTGPITWLGRRYEPRPEIEVKLPVFSGALKDPPVEIVMPLDAFTDRASIGYPHARIRASVVEVIASDPDSWAKVWMIGYVARTVRNFQGLPTAVLLELASIKALLDVPLGITADPECAWTFGGTGCGFDVAAISETRQVVQVIGSSLAMQGIDEMKQWQRGYVELDDLRIGIVTQVGQILTLRQQPPPSWSGATVLCAPGCRGTIDDCRSYAQEAQFGGFGFAIPAHHPIIETP